MPGHMQIGAVLARADVRDVFCATRFAGLDELPRGARIGTSSLRRQAQLLAYREDLRIEPLRGNVDTRLKRLDEGALDAIILASAGLIRLGWESRITAYLPAALCLPAPGQGAIGIECRLGDAQILRAIRPLDHAPTRAALDAERAFARGLGGSCQSPIAALAQLTAARLSLCGLVAEPDGSRLIRESISGAAADAEAIGTMLAERMLEAGAREVLERLRG
jgi:hydroxymethylbilane synthase